MPTQPVNTWEPTSRLDPLFDYEDGDLVNVQLAANLSLQKGTVLGELLGTNDVQNLHSSGALTAGTFTLTFGGQTTSALNWNCTVAQLQAALDALSSIGPGNSTVSGGPLTTPTDFVITFVGALGYAPQSLITITPTGITGGTLSMVHTVTGTVGTKGTYKPYLYSNTDGSQIAKCICQYTLTTDGSGNITLTGEWGVTQKFAPAFVRSYFRMADLVGLDAKAITDMGGRITQGIIGNGIVRF